jgi:hypothetical protein
VGAGFVAGDAALVARGELASKVQEMTVG